MVWFNWFSCADLVYFGLIRSGLVWFSWSGFCLPASCSLEHSEAKEHRWTGFSLLPMIVLQTKSACEQPSIVRTSLQAQGTISEASGTWAS